MTEPTEPRFEQETVQPVLAQGTIYRRPDAAIEPNLAAKDPHQQFIYDWAIDPEQEEDIKTEAEQAIPLGRYLRMQTHFEWNGVEQEIDSNVMILNRQRELSTQIESLEQELSLLREEQSRLLQETEASRRQLEERINAVTKEIGDLIDDGQQAELEQLRTRLAGLITSRKVIYESDSFPNRPLHLVQRRIKSVEQTIETIKRNAELPPILVLPGYMGTGTMNEAAALASTGRKVIVLSHPESPTTAIDGAKLKQWNSTDPYTQFYRQLIGDLKVTLASEGVDLGNDFDAVGWSAGAMMLTALAAEQDEGINIQNLALHNPAGFNRKHWPQVLAGAGGDISRMIASGDSQAFREWLGPLVPPQHQVAPHENNEAGLEKLWQDLRNSTNGIRIAALVGRGLPDELLARLPDSTNLMILASERDQLFPLAEIKDRLRTSGVKHVDYNEARGHGHMGIMTDELNGMFLTRWLRKIRETGSRRATTS